MYLLLFQMENRRPGKPFPNPFTVRSSCKLKFVVRPFVDKEKNGSYPFTTDD
jgi:hypothetical protein